MREKTQQPWFSREQEQKPQPARETRSQSSAALSNLLSTSLWIMCGDFWLSPELPPLLALGLTLEQVQQVSHLFLNGLFRRALVNQSFDFDIVCVRNHFAPFIFIRGDKVVMHLFVLAKQHGFHELIHIVRIVSFIERFVG